ncbi:MAG: DUF2791 family P-loop domain-containing protein [Anaerolineae bacterium]|nr:DUF2791 family P-loop domain-containing protein [Anaerolineae bacterium]
MAERLEIRTFGGLEIKLGARVIERGLPQKAKALLVYLACTARAHPRPVLADLLWDEGSTSQVANNMRVLLSHLRRELGPYLSIRRDTVALDGAAPHRLDAVELAQALEQSLAQRDAAGRLSPTAFGQLDQALALYRGEFLQGFSLRGGSGFEEWLLLERERWLLQIQEALHELVKAALACGQYALGLPHALRWVELDPLNEVALRQTMLLYARTDQWAAALSLFEASKTRLYEDLGLPPAAETITLYEAIKGKHLLAPAAQGGALPALPFLAEPEAPPEAPMFVGRERELAVLDAALEQAQAGHPQLRFIVGGAGRGKTMLVQAFARQAQRAAPDLLAVFGYGHAHTGLGDPYHLFREALALLCGNVQEVYEGGLIDTEHARRLWEAQPQTLPLLVAHASHLVGHFVPGPALLDRATAIAPQSAAWLAQLTRLVTKETASNLQQQAIFDQTTAFLLALAGRRPLLLILEDLHWADPASCALLFHLSQTLNHSPILFIGTYRPEEMTFRGDGERHPLAGMLDEFKRQCGNIWLDLEDMSEDESRRFVAAYLDSEPNRLDEGFREALFRQTGGYPLFTAELLRDMQARGDLHQAADGAWVAGEAVDWQTLPTQVEGVIETRLHRLDAAQQDLLTAACVEGERFTAGVVARVLGLDEPSVAQRFSRELDKDQRLVAAQSLERVGGQRLARYRFRHHLIQHYLYHTLDEVERSYLHEAVGEALEALYGEHVQDVAVQLARHFQKAGITEKAVRYRLLAGKQASGLGDYGKAEANLRTGLELLETLPRSPERDELELMLQITLGQVLTSIHSPAAPDVKKAFDRARELVLQVGKAPQNFSVFHGLTYFYMMRGELLAAHELGQQFMRQAEPYPDSGPLLEAHRTLGSVLIFLGRLAEAQVHLEKSLTLYRSGQSYTLVFDPSAQAKAAVNHAFNTWLLGYPDRARRYNEEALRLVENESNAYAIAHNYIFAGMVYNFMRDIPNAYKCAESAIAQSAEHGLHYWQAAGTILLNVALVTLGKAGADVLEPMGRAVGLCRAIGAVVGLPYFMSLLAIALVEFGQLEQGLALLDEALALADSTEHRTWEPELHRLKGELLLKRGTDGIEAEVCFQRAVALACRQQSRSLELRATMSLCRLWQSQGKTGDAYHKLAGIYDWFSEGFETQDLMEARLLRDSLTARGG